MSASRFQLDTKRTIRSGVPSIPFAKIAEKILGSSYELSFVLCGDALAKRINIQNRGKSYSPNVLSLPLSKNSGEIFLNVRKAHRETKQFGVPVRERVALLFVHGCFHLVGLQHGRTMEAREQKVLREFGIVKK